MKNAWWPAVFLLHVCAALGAGEGDLSLGPGDIIIEQTAESGYDFWIRQKPGVGSVLLVESNRDPAFRRTSYAYRNPVWHPRNGDEKRMIDGAFIDPARKIHSLIDSTPEPHPRLGSAFRIFVPFLVVHGGHQGETMSETEIRDDMFVNFRTFSRPYADYEGLAYRDNPFRLVFSQAPLDGPREKAVLGDTERTFREIAEQGGGDAYTLVDKEAIGATLDRIAADGEGDRLDLVLCLDTTDSMQDDIEYVKKGLIAVMGKYRSRYRTLRVATVFYKDYFDEYLTRVSPFSADIARVERTISGAVVRGGRDTPEAVYEALAAALREPVWEADRRIVILVGDAPPHPRPRGKVTREQVFREAAAAGVKIHAIILPQ